MVVHLVAILHLRPQTKRIVAVCPDIAIDDDGAVSLAVDCHLVGCIAWLYNCAVVVVYSESADDAAVGLWGEYYHAMMQAAARVSCIGAEPGIRL